MMMLNIQCRRMDEILSYPEQGGTDRLTNQGYDITFENVGFSYNSGETVLERMYLLLQNKERLPL